MTTGRRFDIELADDLPPEVEKRVHDQTIRDAKISGRENLRKGKITTHNKSYGELGRLQKKAEKKGIKLRMFKASDKLEKSKAIGSTKAKVRTPTGTKLPKGPKSMLKGMGPLSIAGAAIRMGAAHQRNKDLPKEQRTIRVLEAMFGMERAKKPKGLIQGPEL